MELVVPHSRQTWGFHQTEDPQIHPKSELEMPLTLPGSSVSRKTHVGPS